MGGKKERKEPKIISTLYNNCLNTILDVDATSYVFL